MHPSTNVPDPNAKSETEDRYKTSPPSACTSDAAPRTSDAPEYTPASAAPRFLGRYRVSGQLGVGGFGCVYLGHDDELDRQVAIKVPHAQRIQTEDDVKAFLAEARTVASLDHPHIVPVYDVGHTSDGLCFIVSKYIPGGSLASKLQAGRPTFMESAQLVATIAEALDYAHRQGLTHRDVKPGNILIDEHNQPYVVDFGLALHDSEYGQGAAFAGTPAYMSPEQARREGHRVDGRSDLFSLGVVFYELLTGHRPFLGATVTDLLAAIKHDEPRSLREVDMEVPRQLERICLKALAKQASHRYATARDMLEDLRDFLAAGPSSPSLATSELRIAPRGLRSFEARDAGNFLKLLPGPRDRDGLPESIAFWKNVIEEVDPSQSPFAVGLIFGPSGCGKSSLVKAGLLPRLARGIVPIYLEASPRDTEERLLRRLTRVCGLPAGSSLPEAVAAIRRGQAAAPGKKVLIVLDQFEQWLHANTSVQDSELVQALRQCDGDNVQCLILVRDDFWMLASRFMGQLDIPIAEGKNSTAIDLFDTQHAHKVLIEFGRALGQLPDRLEKEHEAFVQRAIAGIAQDGHIIPVRLAMFAEMVKDKPWLPATLDRLGGTEGVGLAFLEDTFKSAHLRLHEQAARQVLRALLPEAGSNIKGSMLSRAELLIRSGYAHRPADFDTLVRVLDGELRLITPAAEPASQDSSEETQGEYYQLAHDYLVPTLREWLTRKDRETRQGRMALLLEGLAAQWNSTPLQRQLPVLWEWLNIEMYTRRERWSPSEARMMTMARRHHLARLSLVAGLLASCLFFAVALRKHVLDMNRATMATGLVDALREADTEQLPLLVERIKQDRKWTEPVLRQQLATAPPDSREQLHLSLALLPFDSGQVDYLYQRLLSAGPAELLVIRSALRPFKDELTTRLWQAAGTRRQRLQAAAALARFDPDNSKWSDIATDVVADFVATNPVFLGSWLMAFEPVKQQLVAPLVDVFRDPKGDDAARDLATVILIEYAGNDAALMAELLMDADEERFKMLLPSLPVAGWQPFRAELAKQPSASATRAQRTSLHQRQANAAIALCWSGQASLALPLLEARPDPTGRSFLIRDMSVFQVDTESLRKQFESGPDAAVRRGLLLALGSYPVKIDLVKLWLPGLLERYESDVDPGLHGSIAWLLRHWQAEAELGRIDKTLATGKVEGKRLWFCTKQGHTLSVVRGPVKFLMGSPPDEEGRPSGNLEAQHDQVIKHDFAIGACEVTVAQFQRFREDFKYGLLYSPTQDCPINNVSWYEAAAYCNWLSKQEGIPEEQWCYLPNAKGNYDEGMRLAPNHLERTGYRMPTEAEWEFACRAGTTTERYFGNSTDLLPDYVCYWHNSVCRTMPVGSLKPNPLGLFDTLGNALEWCADPFLQETEEKTKSQTPPDVIVESVPRAVRGGSFLGPSPNVRAAFRDKFQPGDHRENIGFRIARTLNDRKAAP